MKYDRVTLKKRADGRWELRKTIDGKRISFYGKTQKECIENFKAGKKKNGNTPTLLPHNLFDMIDLYLKTLTNTSYTTNESVFRVHIFPKLKNKHISKYNEDEIIKFLDNINTDRNRIKAYSLLSNVFSLAVRKKIIKESPMLYIPRPKHRSIKGSALTIAEEEFLLESCKNTDYELMIKFLLYSGCRRSEAYGLKLSDIDFEKNTIHVRGTKTDSSDRYIPIFPALAPVISKCNSGKYLLPRLKSIDTVSRYVHSILPNHKLHDLRHTFATRALEKNVPMKIVQHWLGHSNYSTTADIYTHVLNTTSQEYSSYITSRDPDFDPEKQ